MTKRKVVQIETTGGVLYALCDDGAIFWRIDAPFWKRLPDIPQDEPAEAPSQNPDAYSRA